MTIKAVFFDAAGTLFKPARSVGESYAAFAARHGVNVSPSDLSERFRVCFDEAPRLAFPGAAAEIVDTLERDWWKTVVARVFEPWSPFAKFDSFFVELFAYFAEPRAWTLYPEVLHTLAALKQRGLRLSVISNFDSRLVPILHGLGAGSFFDHILVSSRIGYAKPDREIFHAALKRHALRPEEGLHVGDSDIHDRRGASEAGLRGILIDRRRLANSNDGDRITTLQSLLELFDESPARTT
jgi:putative hydrolase of the HAD superfamily